MHTDAYTKLVLTVIAACLGWLCAIGAAPPVQARQGSMLSDARPQAVVIVGWGTVDRNGRITVAMAPGPASSATDPNIPVNVVRAPTPLDVRLDYSDERPLPVGVSQIRPTGAWEPIRTAAEEEPPRPRPGRR